MMDSKCKICRRASEKLFLKGERCHLKCTLVKKPYPPGAAGARSAKGRRRKNSSEYGTQLREKQKLKFSYGLREKQFLNYVKEALKKKGSAPEYLVQFLESRLDNVTFRFGFADSRRAARQMVSHGHVLVNGRKVNIPSYRVKIGDVISIREGSKNKALFRDLDIKWKKFDPPAWTSLDKTKKEGSILSEAKPEERDLNLNSIIELYSR